MPLERSSSNAALKRNMSTLYGEIGKSPHIQSHAQAVAIALETQRRAKRAYGGGIRGYDDGGSVDTDADGILGAGDNNQLSSGIDPASAAQSAREVAASRLAHAVKPPEGRQEGAFTDALFDALIPGRAAIRNTVSGDYGQAALNAGADLVPAARFVPAPIRRAITGAGIMGAGTLLPVNSEEARAEDLTWMTPQQKSAYNSIRGRDVPETRKLRANFVAEQLKVAQDREDALKQQEAATALAKQQAESASVAEQARIKAASEAEERKLTAMREDEATRREQERQSRLQAEKDAADELERRSKLPFRERHPEIANAIQAGSVVGAGVIPGLQVLSKNYKISQAASRLENALAAGDKTEAALAANVLRQYQNPSTASKITKGISNAEVALLPFEGGTVVPNAWDYYALGGDETNPNWQEARRQVIPTAPNTNVWNNLGMGLVEGIPIAGISKGVTGALTSPTERAAGILKSFEERKRWPAVPKPSASTSNALPPAPAAPTAPKPPAKKRTTKATKTPEGSWSGGSVVTKAGGGGISAVEEAFGDLFSGGISGNNPFAQLMSNIQKTPQGLSGLMGNIPGYHPQTSPSSINSTLATNGVARLAPLAQGAGIAPNMMPGHSNVAAQNRADGGFSMQKGPMLRPSWQSRSEFRNLMHTGPVLSSVPGRTDHHATNVPSGSYVIPADIVSGRGQGNTLAGAKSLQAMFKMGPFGTSIPHLGHGRGIPRGPRPQLVAHSGGGKGGNDNIGSPTPVNIAGGEIVVPPENLMETVHPDLDTAHEIMDAWILNERKNHINTLKKLPGPAKD